MLRLLSVFAFTSPVVWCLEHTRGSEVPGVGLKLGGNHQERDMAALIPREETFLRLDAGGSLLFLHSGTELAGGCVLLSFLFFLWLSSDHALSLSTFRALGYVVTMRPVYPQVCHEV